MPSDLSAVIGEVIDGRYRLGPLVRYSSEGVVLETEYGPEALPAVIKLREKQSEAARWRRAQSLHHPNILTIYDSGVSVLNGAPVAYLVSERADEALSTVLAKRPLTTDETRVLLEAVIAALRFLHEQGLEHARLKPAKVFAVGRELKVACDSALPLNPGDAPSNDVYSLGALVVFALTQRRPERDFIPEFPAPFGEIAVNCLNPDPGARWTLDQVEASLNTPVMPAKPAPVPAPVVEAPPSPRQDPDPNPAPPREDPDRPAPIHDPEPDSEPPLPSFVPDWRYPAIAAGVVLVILLVVLLTRKPPTPAPAAPRAAAPAAATAPTPPPAVEKNAESWWVIVAGYNSAEPAEKRLQALKKRWSRFRPAVARPHSGASPYVITIGQGLTQREAEALRRRAIAAGMPRDTYIKRLR
jgi:hypothetical protein